MADLTELAKLFLGANSQARAAVAADDPYIGFKAAPDLAQALTMRAAQTGDYSNRDLLVAGLLSGLGSGVVEGLSEDYQNRAADAYRKAMIGSAMGQEVDQPDVLSDKLFKSAKDQGEQLQLQQLFSQAESAQKMKDLESIENLKAENAMRQKVVELAATNPRAAQRLINMLGEGGTGLKAAPATAPSASPGAAEIPVPEKPEISEADEYNRLLDETGDPALARDIIRSKKDEKLANEKAVFEYLKPIRENQFSLQNNLESLKTTLEDAGQTGGNIIERAGRSVRLGLGQVVGNEAATQRAGARADLESQALNWAGEIRKMFPGPTSEREFLKYLGAVPGVDKLPETNKRFVERAERLLTLTGQRADFIESAAAAGYTPFEAQRLYGQLDRELPLFKGGELNPDRAELDVASIPFADMKRQGVDIRDLLRGGQQSASKQPAAPQEEEIAPQALQPAGEAQAAEPEPTMPQVGLGEEAAQISTALIGNAADAALFGVPRKLAAGARALYQEGRDLFGVGDNLSLGENYAMEKAIVDAGFEEAKRQAPVSSAAGDIAGAIVSPINKLKPIQAITKARGLGGVAGRAATYAGIGAAQKLGEGETPTAADAGSTALLSVGLDTLVKGGSKLAPLAKDTFNKLTGITAADYRAVAKRLGKTELLKSKIAFNRAFDLLKKEQGIGVKDLVNSNENVLQNLVTKAQSSIASRQAEIDDIVKAADQVLLKEGKGVAVENNNLVKMAKKGLAANEEALKKEGDNIIKEFAEKNKDLKDGALLSSIHKELKALNPFYKVDPAYKDAVTAVADDFRSTLQNTVDRMVKQGKLPADYLSRIKKLNLESRDLINLRNAYAKGLPTAMAEDLIGVAQKAGYTTGGASLQGAKNIGEAIGGQQGATAAIWAAAVAASKLVGRPVSYFLAENNLEKLLSNPKARSAVVAMMNSTTKQPELPDFEEQPFRPNTERTEALFGVKKKISGDNIGGFMPGVKRTAAPRSAKPPSELDSLVRAVIQQESAGNPKAVSSVGAQGLMQLMPATGRELFKKSGLPGKYDPFDPEQNVKLGTMYLQQLLDQFGGDVELALTAYHSGQGRVRRLLRQTKGKTLADILPLLGPVGQKYASSVLRRLNKIKNSPIKV
jgi:soluble lytic murein transglycosylase-like protein